MPIIRTIKKARQISQVEAELVHCELKRERIVGRNQYDVALSVQTMS